MDLSTVRARRRKSLFRPWNSYLAKKGAVEASPQARQLDANRARAHAGLSLHTTPLVRLSVKLIDTYEGINANYYKSRASVQPQHTIPSPHHSTSDIYYSDHHSSSTATVQQTCNTTHNTDPSYLSNANTANSSQHNLVSSSTQHSIASPLSIQYCDENFDYIVRTGEMFNNRYMLEKVIGRGSFGQVVRALDTRQNTHVAVKIIKNNTLYVEQALSEVRMTSFLNSIDPDDEHCIMRLRDKFIYRGHQCLVLELLSFSLYDLLRSTDFYGVSLNLVRKFCKQILKCLSFLARSDINIAHCDLKPENVLLRHPQRSAIKVVDFGASCRISESMFTYVQSRFYRAPEVILGLPYTTQVDVWSLGCMLIELHTGYPLFAGKDEADQIAVIVERIGLPPNHMLQSGKKTAMFFQQDIGTGAWSLKPNLAETHGMPGSKPIRTFVDFHTGTANGKRKRVSGGHSEQDYEIFLSLAAKMLLYDPEQRITAEQATNDLFVRGGLALSRSGRDSPPQIPESLAAVGESVPHELHPGRKAPVQRIAQERSTKSVRIDVGNSSDDKKIRRHGSESEREGHSKFAAGSSKGESSISNMGGKLRLSKSEPLFEPVAKKTFVFKRSDWAEEVGIDPPPWRVSGGSIRVACDRESWGGPVRRDGRNLTAAGGGGQLVQRRKCRTGVALRGSGNGCGWDSGLGQAAGMSNNVMWTAGTVGLDEYCWESRRAKDLLGLGYSSAGARVGSMNENGSSGQGRGVTLALPRGHGNALLLFTT